MDRIRFLKRTSAALFLILSASALYAPVYTDPAVSSTPQQTHLLSSSSLINVVPWRASSLQNPRSGTNKNSMLMLNRRSSSYTPKAVLDLYSHNASNRNFKLPSIFLQRYGERESYLNLGPDGHWILQTGHDTRGEMYLQPGGGYLQIGQDSSQNNRGSSDPKIAATAYHTNSTMNVHAKSYFHNDLKVKNSSGAFINVVSAVENMSALSTTINNQGIVTRRIIDRDDAAYYVNPNQNSSFHTVWAQVYKDHGNGQKVLDLSGTSHFHDGVFRHVGVNTGELQFFQGNRVRQLFRYVDGEGVIYARPNTSDSAMNAINFYSNANFKNPHSKKINISGVVPPSVTRGDTENGIYFNEHPVLTANDSAGEIWINPSLTRSTPPTFRRVNIGVRNTGYNAQLHRDSIVFNAYGQMASFGLKSLNRGDGSLINGYMVDPAHRSTVKWLDIKGENSNPGSDRSKHNANFFINQSPNKHAIDIHRTKSDQGNGHAFSILATHGNAQVMHLNNQTNAAGLKLLRPNVNLNNPSAQAQPLLEVFDDRHEASGRRNATAINAYNRDKNTWTAQIANHGSGQLYQRRALYAHGNTEINGELKVHHSSRFQGAMRIFANLAGIPNGRTFGDHTYPGDTAFTVFNNHSSNFAPAAHFAGKSNTIAGTHRAVLESVNLVAGGPAIRAVNRAQGNGWGTALHTADGGSTARTHYRVEWRAYGKKNFEKQNGNSAIVAVNENAGGHGISTWTASTKEALIAHSNGNTGIFSVGDVKTSSSIRWKTDIKRIQNPIEKLLKLEGVTFIRKDKIDKSRQMGLIAERVGAVIPEVVDYEENGIDAKSVAYGKLTALLIEALKAEHATVNTLKKDLADTQSKLDKLESRLLALEKTHKNN